MVYEQGGWHPQGWEGQHCPVDRKKLKAIKKSATGLAPAFPSDAQIMCSEDGIPSVGSPCSGKQDEEPQELRESCLRRNLSIGH